MKALFALVCGVLVATAPAAAHHSFAAQYDADKPFTLTGSVVSVEWTNPHIHILLDVKDTGGTVTRWKLEGYPPNMLASRR
jgi:hypothetical protein